MPSEVRSPRTLSSWLELDYHRRRRLLTEEPDRRRTEASRFGAAGN